MKNLDKVAVAYILQEQFPSHDVFEESLIDVPRIVMVQPVVNQSGLSVLFLDNGMRIVIEKPFEDFSQDAMYRFHILNLNFVEDRVELIGSRATEHDAIAFISAELERNKTCMDSLTLFDTKKRTIRKIRRPPHTGSV